MIIEIIKFFVYSILIVLISKYILVKALRNLAENLKLKPRFIGNIAGVATSIPELLTVTVSSFRGLVGTSLYNIISSNVINFIQYIISLIIYKNYTKIKNKGILLSLENSFNIILVITLVILYFVFSFISKKSHEKYLKDQEDEGNKSEEDINKKTSNRKTYIYVLYILVSGILLYFVGNELGNVLENLSAVFDIAEFVLGILLGAITSIPELITFFEAQRHYTKDKYNNDKSLLGVVEATNNLLTSNMLNLFIIQSIGILIYII